MYTKITINIMTEQIQKQKKNFSKSFKLIHFSCKLQLVTIFNKFILHRQIFTLIVFKNCKRDN